MPYWTDSHARSWPVPDVERRTLEFHTNRGSGFWPGTPPVAKWYDGTFEYDGAVYYDG